MDTSKTLLRTVVNETLVAVGVAIACVVALALGLLVVVAVIFWLVVPAGIPPTIIFSPDGKAAVKKQYGPLDEAAYVELSILPPGQIFHHSYHLATLQNPTGVTNEDGATISWDGNHHIVMGWPVGGVPIKGPSRIDDIQISYRMYDPVLSHVPAQDVVNLPLHHVTVRFREQHVQDTHARYRATGRPVEHIRCIVEVNGFDGSVFGNVTAEVGGTAVGSGIGLKVAVTPLSRGLARQQTLTQAELADVFPQNDLTSAPGQEGGAVMYRLFTASEAQRVFSAVGKGRIDLLVALNLGEKVIRYKGDALVSSQVINSFNACSSKTSFYGAPFVVRPE